MFGVLLLHTIYEYGKLTEFVSCYLQLLSVLKLVLASALEEWTTERLGRWIASKVWFTLVASQVKSPRLDILFNLNLLLYIIVSTAFRQ